MGFGGQIMKVGCERAGRGNHVPMTVFGSMPMQEWIQAIRETLDYLNEGRWQSKSK